MYSNKVLLKQSTVQGPDWCPYLVPEGDFAPCLYRLLKRYLQSSLSTNKILDRTLLFLMLFNTCSLVNTNRRSHRSLFTGDQARPPVIMETPWPRESFRDRQANIVSSSTSSGQRWLQNFCRVTTHSLHAHLFPPGKHSPFASLLKGPNNLVSKTVRKTCVCQILFIHSFVVSMAIRNGASVNRAVQIFHSNSHRIYREISRPLVTRAHRKDERTHGEDIEKLGPLCAVAGNADWCGQLENSYNEAPLNVKDGGIHI